MAFRIALGYYTEGLEPYLGQYDSDQQTAGAWVKRAYLRRRRTLILHQLFLASSPVVLIMLLFSIQIALVGGALLGYVAVLAFTNTGPSILGSIAGGISGAAILAVAAVGCTLLVQGQSWLFRKAMDAKHELGRIRREELTEEDLDLLGDLLSRRHETA